MKKRSKAQTGYFPETVPNCYFEYGQLVVPPEHEDYYVRVWKWLKVRGHKLENYKQKYLKEYEEKNGEITKWRDHSGNLRAF